MNTNLLNAVNALKAEHGAEPGSAAVSDEPAAASGEPAETYLDRGMLFANRGDYEIAVEEFTEAIKIDPSNAGTYLLRGKALMASICTMDNRREDFNAILYGQLKEGAPAERIDTAIADFIQAIKLDPQSAAAYQRRGHAYCLKKDYDRAIADYNRAIKLDPGNARVYFSRGTAYKRKGEHDRARAD